MNSAPSKYAILLLALIPFTLAAFAVHEEELHSALLLDDADMTGSEAVYRPRRAAFPAPASGDGCGPVTVNGAVFTLVNDGGQCNLATGSPCFPRDLYDDQAGTADAGSAVACQAGGTCTYSEDETECTTEKMITYLHTHYTPGASVSRVKSGLSQMYKDKICKCE